MNRAGREEGGRTISRVRLFVSASADMEPEREAIGRALTEFPINLGWEIKRTPRPGQPVDLEAVQDADIFVLLFGSDIQAPVGWEWMRAQRGEHLRLAFLKQSALQTPAGREFAHELRGEWRPFRTGGELARQILQALAAHILEHWQDFGLSAQEWETLADYLARLRGKRSEPASDAPSPEEDAQEPSGAGGGGVILAPGRDTPKGGVIVED